MNKTINYIKNKITFFNFFLGVTLFGIIILLMSVFINFKYTIDMTKSYENNQAKIETIMREINNNLNNNEITIKNHELPKENFLNQYYINQADWLNKWLTALAIIMAVLGIMIPICFVKFLENKEKEMDRIIEDTKKQKDEMQLQVNEVTIKYDEIKQKSEQVSKDLEDIKLQVNKNDNYLKEIGSLSNYNEAMSILSDKNIEPNKLQEANQLLEEAISLNPKNDKALYKLGNLYYKQKDYTNAVLNIKKAINIKDVSTYFYDLGLIYRKQDLIDLAIENISIAIQKEYDIHNKAFYCSYLAILYAKINNVEEVNKTIQQALSYNYKNTYVYNNIASAYSKVGQYEPAINILESILNIIPNQSTYYNLTEAYIFTHKFEKALSALSQYIEIQHKKLFYGIYKDDYQKWIEELNNAEQTDTIIKIKELIEQLEKRDRE